MNNRKMPRDDDAKYVDYRRAPGNINDPSHINHDRPDIKLPEISPIPLEKLAELGLLPNKNANHDETSVEKIDTRAPNVVTTTAGTMAELAKAIDQPPDVTDTNIEITGPITINKRLTIKSNSNTHIYSTPGKQYTILRDPSLKDIMLMTEAYGSDKLAHPLTLSNIIFDGNKDKMTGGSESMIATRGDLTINPGTVIRNQRGSYGGAIGVSAGDVTINGGEFINNEGMDIGGAAITMYNGGSLIIKDGLFSGNVVNNSKTTYGGAILILGATKDIIIGDKDTNKGPLFINNKANSGGAITLYSYYIENVDFYVYGGTFTNNYAAYLGGAILITLADEKNFHAYIKSGIFSENTAESWGGAVMMKSDSQNTSIMEIGDPKVTATPHFYNNTAGTSGTIATYSSKNNAMTLWVRCADIHDNTANSGGGVGAMDNTLIIGDKENNGRIEPKINRNKAMHGGGCSVSYADHFEFISGSIDNNEAYEAGGLYLDVDEYDESRHSVIGDVNVLPPPSMSYNIATDNGGGLYLQGTQVDIIRANITHNTADKGGGVLIEEGFRFSIGGPANDYPPVIADNKARDSGGGIKVDNVYEHFDIAVKPGTAAIIQDNIAEHDGGGISLEGYFQNMYIGPGAQFQGNIAMNGPNRQLDDQDKTTYENNIHTTSYSNADPPFENLYNNYDIGYAWHTLTLIGCDGKSVYNTKIVRHRTGFMDVKDPSGAGMTFEGWFEDPDYTWAFEKYYSIYDDMTLYAKCSCNNSNQPNRNNDCTRANSLVGASLIAIKSALGAPLPDSAFQFGVYDDSDNFITSAWNDASGNIAFPEINFDAPGDYEFTIREISKTQMGWTCDKKEYKAQVHVEYDATGDLVASIRYPGGVPQFVNTFDIEPASYIFRAQKIVYGANLVEDQFRFALYDESGAEIAQTKNDRFGNIIFPKVTFDRIGSYRYTMRELNVGGNGWTLDTSDKVVAINVTYGGNGHLIATPANPNQTPQFVNRYRASSGNNGNYNMPNAYRPVIISCPQNRNWPCNCGYPHR